MTKRLTIIGAGIPGLALGVDVLLQFGKGQAVVQIYDSAPPPVAGSLGDHRTTAFMPPAQSYLRGLGVWQDVQDQAAALNFLRLVDDRGPRWSKPLIETFDARDFGEEAFALNAPNSDLRAALVKRFEDLGGTIHWQTGFAKLDADPRTEGLLVGADGQQSAVRQHLGITLDNRKPDQTAVVCTATHDLDQRGTSTEFHRDAGPFTLVPAPPSPQGQHRTAIVWVEKPDTAQALAALSPRAFADKLQANARGLLGQVLETTTPICFPVATLQSTALGQPGALLMAEAAHALPPIGAQGLNLSLADAKTLGSLLTEHDDWQAKALVDGYERARQADIGMRLNATDALNRVTTWQSSLRDPVTFGVLGLIKHVPRIRERLVRTGLGL